MELHSQRLSLREFRQNDFEAVREFESNPETHRYERAVPEVSATRAYIDRAVAWSRENPRSHYRLAVTLVPEDLVRGRVSLTLNNAEIREWEMGWAVHFRYWGNGYATEAARAVLGFAFGELRAHRVVAFCNALNTASTRVMDKIGMQPEGRLRETRWWNGGWADEFVYAILDRDWDSGS
jgi:ribosomal-protein-alanine N-acetyltransferase